MIDNLCEVTEERMIAAHKSGAAFYKHNRYAYTALGWLPAQVDALSVARSTGWHGALAECWAAGFFGYPAPASQRVTMTPQDKLRHAPRARQAYALYVYEQEKLDQYEWLMGLLLILTPFLFAGLPFVLFYSGWLP